MLNDTTRCRGQWGNTPCALRDTCQRHKQIAEDTKRPDAPSWIPVSSYLGEVEGMGYRCRNRIEVEESK